ncbi:SDR family NAD(P)-dependent oxidoreductase [Paenibacillus sp. NPDC055715]
MANENGQKRSTTSYARSKNKGQVAVVGMACRFPGADNHGEYWDNLSQGVDSIQEIPSSRWDSHKFYSPDIDEPNKSISKWCGLVDDIDQFDHRFFDISPREANNMDPQQRLVLEETLHCIEDSGIPMSVLKRKRTSVFIGVMAIDYLLEAVSTATTIENYAGTGNYECILANRISHYFGFNGSSFTLDAACASSLVALHEAKKSLLSGECDFAIVGGVNLNIHPWKYITWSKSRMLSPDGRCKTFDKDANGYVPGDGVGVILLQRKQDAIRMRSHVYGLIRGSAVNHVGSALSMTVPSVEAQMDVIDTAYKDADLNPDTVTYVEAHGTGTSLGDPIEIEALKQVFGRSTQDRQFCTIGSVKTNIGHLEAAAGIAGLIKVLLMMKHRKIPKTLHVRETNPMIQLEDSAFRIATEHLPWLPKQEGIPLRAGISSFGIGGVNSHCLVESYSQAEDLNQLDPPGPSEEGRFFVLSAKSENSLKALLGKWKQAAAHVITNDQQLSNVSKALAHTRASYPYRAGGIVASREELLRRLEEDAYSIRKPSSNPIHVAIGGMRWEGFTDMEKLYRSLPLFKKKTDNVIASLSGDPYLKKLKRGFFEQNWDPALVDSFSFIAAYGFVEALLEIGLNPEVFYGESHGFLICLALSGVIQVKEALMILLYPDQMQDITLRRPSQVMFDPVRDAEILPIQFSEEYLRQLTANINVHVEASRLIIRKARLLIHSQFTFKKYMQEWTNPLQARCLELDFLLADESLFTERELDGKGSLLLIMVTSSLKRLHEKWNLTEQEHLSDPRIDELVNLIVDGVLDKERVAGLLLDASPDYEGSVLAMNAHQVQGKTIEAYPLLQKMNDILPESFSWLMTALECPIRLQPKAMKLIVLGDTAIVEGDAIAKPHVSTLGELFQHTVFSMWQEGADVRWEHLYPVDSYVKESLPGYVFEHKRFWFKVDESPAIQAKPAAQESSERKLTVREAIIQDHIIGSQHIVPGACMLVHGLEAVNAASVPSVHKLLNVRVHKPGIVSDAIRLKSTVNPGNRTWQISSGQQILCTGQYEETADHAAYGGFPSVDMRSEIMSKAVLYGDIFAPAGYRYGTSLQVIEGVYDHDDCFAIAIKQPEGEAGCNSHVLDGVFQAVLAAAYAKGIVLWKNDMDVPYKVGAMMLSAPFSDISYVVINKNGLIRNPDGRLQLNLEVYSSSGAGVMSMEDVQFVSVNQEVFGGPREPEQAKLSTPKWIEKGLQPVNQRFDERFQGRTAVIFTNQSAAVMLRKAFPEPFDQMITVKMGQCFSVEGEHWEINGGNLEDYSALWRELENGKERELHLFYLRLTDEPIPVPYDGIEAEPFPKSYEPLLQEIFYFLKSVSLESHRFKASTSIVISGYDSFAVLPADSGDGVLNGLITGLAKAVMRENPRLEITFADFRKPQEDMIETLVHESLWNAGDHLLAYRDGQRFVQQYHDLHLSPQPHFSRLKQDGVYLVIGGFGGIGTQVIEQMNAEAACQVIIVGRSPLDDQKRSQLSAYQAKGYRVSYYRNDITQAQEVKSLVASVKEIYGHIHGILHLGGVLKDELLFTKSWESFRSTIRPKWDGTLLLNHYTRSEPLDWFIMFSSVVSVFGNRGQTDYAASNSFLDQFAFYRSTHGYPGETISINWPLWAESGMGLDPKAYDNFVSRKLFPISNEAGKRIFSNLLSCVSIPNQILVMPEKDGSMSQTMSNTEIHRTGDEDCRFNPLESFITGLISSHLGMPPEELEWDESFFTLGLDSVVLMEVMAKLNERFDHLPPTLLYDYPTMYKVLDYFRERIGKGEMVFGPADISPSPVNQPLVQAESVQESRTALERTQAHNKLERGDRSQSHRQGNGYDIAIIGMNGRFPQSPDLQAYWENLIHGRDCIQEIPPERWDNRQYYNENPRHKNTTYGRWGGFIEDVDKFDPLFFKISPKEAEEMDPQQRLLLESVWKTMEDAGYGSKEAYAQQIIGHYTGVMWNEYSHIAAEEGFLHHEYAGPGSIYWAIANRVSYLMDFKGPSMAIDTACSSSLSAIHLACQGILHGDCDMAVAGGINLSIHPAKYIYLAQAGFLSVDGKCRSFGDAATGYVPGEGVGTVLLKPLQQAVQDRDHIYGIIRGSSINHGGQAPGFTIPSSEAHADLIGKALRRAELSPEDISYVECQGTGTALGDPIEINGLSQAFRQYTDKQQFCPIGSVKSNIGHLEAAGGSAALIKVLLAMKHKQIPRSLHSDLPNPKINFKESPFFVAKETLDWHPSDGKTRIAGISSFGAGGANAHLIVEEYSESSCLAEEFEENAPQLFMLSAKSKDRLEQYLIDMYSYLSGTGRSHALKDIAFTLQTGRKMLEERIAVIACHTEELIEKLGAIVRGDTQGIHVFRGRASGRQEPVQNPESFVKDASSEMARLERLAVLWIQGMKFDWHQLMRQHGCRRVPLPTYPFERKRYWLDHKGERRMKTGTEVAMPDPIVQNSSELDSPLHSIPVQNGSLENNPGQLEQFEGWLIGEVSELIKISAGDIDVEDDISEYGFDSMSYTDLTERINQTYQLSLTPTVFFEHPSIHSFACYVCREYGDKLDFNDEAPVTTDRGEGIAITSVPATDSVSQANLQLYRVKGPDNSTSDGIAGRDEDAVAIIGMSCRFPESENLQEYWDNLLAGKDMISQIPEDRWDWRKLYGDPVKETGKTNIKWGGFIKDVHHFDAAFFGISPREAELMDPQQRLFMETVWETIEDSGYKPSELWGSKTGVFVGATTSDYIELLKENRVPVEAHTSTGLFHSILANRISYYFNFHGPSEPVDTACSASLVAVSRAVESLKNGRCDLAIAGGVNVLLSPTLYISFNKAGMLSPEGRCRTFDDQANGYVRGEGSGAVLLKPLRKALQDKDRIYGVIRGYSVNHGGRSNSLTAPNPNAQTDLIVSAYRMADIHPGRVRYIETHGTGTSLGDPIEINSLKKAFQELNDLAGIKSVEEAHCVLGAVKTNIGHLEAAAGMAGLLKVLMCLKHQKIPSNLHFNRVNPYIHLENSPFRLATETSEWVASQDETGTVHPRVAGVSSFGVGGVNAHVVIEEYPVSEKGASAPAQPAYLFAFTAQTEISLRKYIAKFMRWLSSDDGKQAALGDIAHTLLVRKTHFDIRQAVIAGSKQELQQRLQSLLDRGVSEGVFSNQVDKRQKDMKAFYKQFGNQMLGELREGTNESEAQYVEKLKELAELFVKGCELEWSELYNKAHYCSVMLPTYAFDRKPHWFKGTSGDQAADAASVKQQDVLHPLIDSNVSTLEQQRFSKLIYPEAFYLRDHMVGQDHVLPAVVYLEMSRAAGALSLPAKQVQKIKNIVWMKPVVAGGEVKKINVLLSMAQQGVNYQVVSVSDDPLQENVIHSQGTLMLTEATDVPSGLAAWDIEAIRQRCNSYKHGEACYQEFQEYGLNYGPSFQTIEMMHYNSREALSALRLPAALQGVFAGYVLFPSHMDGALQSVLALVGGNGSKQAYLPFSMGEVELLAPMTETGYAYARVAEGGNLRAFDIDITDEWGQPLVKIKDFTIAGTGGSLTEPKSTDILYWHHEWRESAAYAGENQSVFEDIVIFSNDEGLEEKLESRTTSHDGRVIRVRQGEKCRRVHDRIYEVLPGSEESYSDLLSLWRRDGIKPSHIVHLWSTEDYDSRVTAVREQMVHSYDSLFYISKAWMNEKLAANTKLLYFYPLESNMIHPVYGAVAAFLKTLKQESRHLTGKSIGLDSFQIGFLLEHVYNELNVNDSAEEDELLLQGNSRFARMLTPCRSHDFDADGIEPKQGGVYLITGGTGGLGMVFARYLLQRYQARVVLAGRSELNEDQIRELQSLDGDLMFVPCDVSNQENVTGLLANIHHAFGTINGVIHSAGSLRDGYIPGKQREDMEEVFSAKIYGLSLLDTATQTENLDFFVLFSSIVALTGNAGQCDYAYANSYMDHFASYRERLRKEGLRRGKTLSINWPLWKGGGMKVDQKAQEKLEQRLGMKAIDSATGIEAFSAALKYGGHQILVDEHGRDIHLFLNRRSEIQPAAQIGSIREGHGSEAARKKLEGWLTLEIADVLRISQSEINMEDDMRDYGFDSVLLTELANRINAKYDLDILPPIFFEHSSISSFSRYLIREFAGHIAASYQQQPPLKAEVPSLAAAQHAVQTPSVELREAKEAPVTHIRQEQLSGSQQASEVKPSSGDVTNRQETGQRHEESTHYDKSGQQEPIAVIGLSAKFPESEDIGEFWDNLENGRELIREIPADRWDFSKIYGDPLLEPGKTNIKWGGFMKEVDKFDASFFGISPREAEMMDPQARIFLEIVWNTIEDAGYKTSDLWGSKTGLFVGVSTSDYGEVIRDEGVAIDAHTSTGLSHSMLANRISYLFNLRGPSEPVDTACSSSLVAVHRAMEAIRNGSCEQAIVGGVNVLLSPSLYISFNKAGMLSPDGSCKTFDERADGYVRGEGCGALLLKPLSKAIADKNRIYGVIKGSSINHQGRSNSLTAPNPNSQAELLVDAYTIANMLPSRVGYIEAHGTGTSLGDPVEINGLKKAFEELYSAGDMPVDQRPSCAIGSVKTNIGHLEAAAGIAGMIKVLLMMEHKKIPGNANFKKLNPFIKLEGSPFYIASELQAWKPMQDQNGAELPRVAGVSSFGFGGVNAHVVIEEYMTPESLSSVSSGPQLIVLSAKTEESLRARAEQLLKFATALDTHTTQEMLAQIAYTLQVGRESMEARLAFAADSLQDMMTKLREYLSGESGEDNVEGLWNSYSSQERQGASLLVEGPEGQQFVDMLIRNVKLEKLGQLWTLGIQVDWRLLYEGRNAPRLVSLPGYPFERTRYWLDSRGSSEPAGHREIESNTKALEANAQETEQADIAGVRPNVEIGSRRENDKVNQLHLQQPDIPKLKLKQRGMENRLPLSEVESPLTKAHPSRQRSQAPIKLDMPPVDNTGSIDLAAAASPSQGAVYQPATSREQDTLKPAETSAQRGTIHLPDKKEVQLKLRAMLADTLHVEEDTIQDKQTFTDMGLDSILVIELVKKINRAFRTDIKAVKIYDYASVHSLSEYLATIIPPEEHMVQEEIEEKKLISCPDSEVRSSSSDRVGNPVSEGWSSDVAIIGMSGRFPGAADLTKFWENLKTGVSSITEIPADRWSMNDFYDADPSQQDKTHSKWGGFLEDIDQFDPLFFNISPSEAEVMDPQQRLFLEQAWCALEEAGYSAEALDCVKCGVYVGAMNHDYQDILENAGISSRHAQAMTGNAHSILASRIAYLLNLKGPAIQLDTACSSALVAIHMACQSLINGEAEMMLAGGVTLYITENPYIQMSNAGMLSAEGKCKAFDQEADGFVPGEGVGVVVLKLLEHAIRDNDHIYGVIKGSGINQDGKTNGITAPSIESQKSLELGIYQKYGIHPESISYIEAHGTGTKLGDPIEVQALTDAFRVYTDKDQFCGIGSVKTNIGHTSAAAGVASLIKVLLSFKHRQIPPSLHFAKENELIGFGLTPFYVNTRLTPWTSDTLRRAAISSFGFGGTNAHLVVEEYAPIQDHRQDRLRFSSHLVPLSARSSEQLRAVAEQLVAYLNQNEELSLDDVAYTLQLGRTAFEKRLAIVASSVKQLRDRLISFCEGTAGDHEPGLFRESADGHGQAFAQENSEYTERLLQARNYEEIAALWVRGETIDWAPLYHQRPPGLFKRLSLPTYPFHRQRCWVRSGKANGAGSLKPWSLDTTPALNIAEHGLVYAIRIHEQAALFQHHRIAGLPLFPGMGLMSLVMEICSKAAGADMQLQRMVWQQPLWVNQNNADLRVLVRLQEEGLDFSIQRLDEHGEQYIVHAQGECAVVKSQAGSSADPERMSIGEIQRRCSGYLGQDEIYDHSEMLGIHYGPYFRGVQEAWAGTGEALGRIDLSITDEASYSNRLHPAVLDNALQCIAALVWSEQKRIRRIPYAVGKAEVSGPMPCKGYAYVTRKDADQERFHITVMNEDGHVAARLHDVTLRPMEDPEGPLVYVPFWDQRPIEESQLTPAVAKTCKDRVLVIHSQQSANLKEALLKAHAESGDHVVCIELGTESEKLSDTDWNVDIRKTTELFHCIQQFEMIDQIYFLARFAVAPEENTTVQHRLRFLEDSEETGVLSLFRLVQALQQRGFGDQSLKLSVVTCNACEVVPGEAIQPAGASLHGFARSLAKEFRHWKVNCLDVSEHDLQHNSSSTLVRQIAMETSGCDKDVAIRNGKRYERRLEQVISPAVSLPASRFKHRGVYLIAGGTGGIGMELCEYLARTAKARLVLIGRRMLDDKRKQRISRVEALGAEVLYLQADICDYNSMRHAVEQATARFGEINGAIHSAMILQDKTVANMDESMLRDVLGPKVKGSVVLHEVLRQEPLDFMLYFSSAESLLCQAGQSNYAAASTFMDAYAGYVRQHVPYPVSVINWGYWGSVGIVAEEEYRERMVKMGVHSIEPHEGMQAVEQVLALDHSLNQFFVVKGERRDLRAMLPIDSTHQIEIFREALPEGLLQAPLEVPHVDRQELARNLEAFRQLERWVQYAVLDIFRSMGVFQSGTERYTYDVLLKRTGVSDQHLGLFEVLIHALDEAGFIEVETMDHTTMLKAALVLDTEELRLELQSLEASKDRLVNDFPSIMPHVNLVWACKTHYPALLTGRKNVMEVMFPGGSMSLVEGVYHGFPIGDYFNLLTAQSVRHYVQQRLERSPDDKICILELGAGTGGTSGPVLEAVKDFKEHIRYVYTDISSGFIRYGEKVYGSDYPFVHFQTLDIEQPVEEQGFAPASIDMVISANVIHATKDIAATLNQLKRLLKTNGVFLANEAARVMNFANFTFGLTEGWWRFDDGHKRLPSSPLLSASLWRKAMQQSGMRSVQTLGSPDTDPESTQCLIIGESNGVTRARTAVIEPGRVHQPLAFRPKNAFVAAGKEEETKAEVEGASASQEELRERTVDYVKQVFAEILNIDPSQMTEQETFERYGVDSLISLQIVKRFEDDLGNLSSTLLFEYMTAGKLTDYFTAEKSSQLNTLFNLVAPSNDRTLHHALSIDPVKADAETACAEDIAIIGMSGRYPGAEQLDEFWDNLINGKNCIGQVPDDRWDWKAQTAEGQSRWGGFIDDVDTFDPLFFHMTPEDSENMDPQARLFMETAWSAFEDASYTSDKFERMDNEVGVFVGVMNADYEFMSGEAYGEGRMTLAHASHWSIANRISYRFNLFGPSLTVDTACSSSLTVIHLACESLKRGECKMAVAGGVNLILHPMHYHRLASMNMITKGDACKSFGDEADGFVDGEGAGAVILKPLRQAIADQDHIHAVIKGSAVNAGGKTSGFTVPNPTAQAKVVAKVMEKSGIHPRTISYVEAHGTGTSLGDPIEIAGLTKAYRAYTQDTGYCSVGSVKSNIGHLESAAGIAGLTKVILQMKHKQIVPSLHSDVLNPKIAFEDTPFYVQHQLKEWTQPVVSENGKETRYPRRAGISSFGAGGANAHVLIEEYDAPIVMPAGTETETIGRSEDLFILSAMDKDRLKEYAGKLALYLKKHMDSDSSLSMANLAYTLQTGRENMAERLAVIAKNADELLHKINMFIQGNLTIDRVFTGNIRKAGRDQAPLSTRNGDNREAVVHALQAGNLDMLAQLWVAGEAVDWELLHKEKPRTVIPAPTYPYAKNRYWMKTVQRKEAKSTTEANSAMAEVRDDNIDAIADIESRITLILADILRKSPDQMLTDQQLELDHFDSMKLIMKATHEFGQEVDPLVILNHKTIHELTVYLGSLKTACAGEQVHLSGGDGLQLDQAGGNSPKGEVLEKILGIVSEIMGTEPVVIDPDADISDYGLNSINIMFLHHKLQELFGQNIDPLMIMNNRTLRDLADFLVDQNMISEVYFTH